MTLGVIFFISALLFYNIKSEMKEIEKIQTKIEAEIQILNQANDLIGEKTSALAILYQKNCLIDKSKSDAVKIYLTYEIDLAKIEYRTNDVKQFEKEMNEF